jgi:hypothetical protein
MRVFRLVRAGSVLGQVAIDHQDVEYLTGRFSELTDAFAPLRHFFEEYWVREGDSRRAIWREITEPGIWLEPLEDGEPVPSDSILIRDATEVSGRVPYSVPADQAANGEAEGRLAWSVPRRAGTVKTNA